MNKCLLQGPKYILLPVFLIKIYIWTCDVLMLKKLVRRDGTITPAVT